MELLRLSPERPDSEAPLLCGRLGAAITRLYAQQQAIHERHSREASWADCAHPLCIEARDAIDGFALAVPAGPPSERVSVKIGRPPTCQLKVIGLLSSGRSIEVRELARQSGIRAQHLRKVVSQLRKKGLTIRSRRVSRTVSYRLEGAA